MDCKPKLRFPEFYGEWENKRLGDVAKFLDGKRIPLKSSDRAKRNGPYPYYGASGIIDYVDDYIFDEELVLLGEDGANIITRNSRMAFLARGKYWVNNHAHVIKGLDDTNQYFLSEQLERVNYAKFNTGTAQPKLNQDVCKKIPLKMPKIKEQQKIASFLSKVDSKIDLLEKKQDLWETYKKGIMQQIFSQKLRFKDENGKDYPDWEEKKLKNISQEVKRVSKTGSEEVLTISAGKGFISQKERWNKVIAGNSLKKYVLLRKNELSYNRGNSKRFPYGCIYKLGHESALVPNVYRSFSVNQNPDFYAQFFAGGNLNRQLIRIISSSARMDGLLNISKGNFFRVKVPVPLIQEQEKIGTFLVKIDDKIDYVKNELEIIKKLKKGLLQQMFC